MIKIWGLKYYLIFSIMLDFNFILIQILCLTYDWFNYFIYY